MPEAKLCREASLRYATVGMITDYDCWHQPMIMWGVECHGYGS